MKKRKHHNKGPLESSLDSFVSFFFSSLSTKVVPTKSLEAVDEKRQINLKNILKFHPSNLLSFANTTSLKHHPMRQKTNR